MLQTRAYWWGVASGVVGIWAFHRFVRPLPGANGGG